MDVRYGAGFKSSRTENFGVTGLSGFSVRSSACIETLSDKI